MRGPVGLAGMLFAQAMGAEVIGIDTSATRRELAARLGAADVVDAARKDAAETVKRWSAKDGVDASFETSGSAAAQAVSVAVTGRGGRVAFVGFGSATPSITPADIIVKQLSLMGSFVFPIDAYYRILDFVQRRKVP